MLSVRRPFGRTALCSRKSLLQGLCSGLSSVLPLGAWVTCRGLDPERFGQLFLRRSSSLEKGLCFERVVLNCSHMSHSLLSLLKILEADSSSDESGLKVPLPLLLDLAPRRLLFIVLILVKVLFPVSQRPQAPSSSPWSWLGRLSPCTGCECCSPSWRRHLARRSQHL